MKTSVRIFRSIGDEWQICLIEVVALEKKGLAGIFGECIGTAVSQIQPRRMPPLAVDSPGLSSQFGLFRGYVDDFNPGAMQEKIELPAPRFTPPISDRSFTRDKTPSGFKVYIELTAHLTPPQGEHTPCHAAEHRRRRGENGVRENPLPSSPKSC